MVVLGQATGAVNWLRPEGAAAVAVTLARDTRSTMAGASAEIDGAAAGMEPAAAAASL